jgi:hypothetical protein
MATTPAGDNLHPAREFHAIAAILSFFASDREAHHSTTAVRRDLSQESMRLNEARDEPDRFIASQGCGRPKLRQIASNDTALKRLAQMVERVPALGTNGRSVRFRRMCA